MMTRESPKSVWRGIHNSFETERIAHRSNSSDFVLVLLPHPIETWILWDLLKKRTNPYPSHVLGSCTIEKLVWTLCCLYNVHLPTHHNNETNINSRTNALLAYHSSFKIPCDRLHFYTIIIWLSLRTFNVWLSYQIQEHA